jgi:oxygen-independent coproporphyrinogen-3 oxidase
MAGIYIHIPFCKTKCHYCNFFSLASTKYKSAFVEALIIELKLRSAYLNDEVVETIYFGGGTPSMLSISDLEMILGALYSNYIIADHAEVTLEANPDDLTDEYLKSLSKTAINRLSMGIQSFNNQDLKFLNRAHDGNKALEAIDLARKYNFDNLTIDLIYGIQGSSDVIWKENLKIVHKLKIPHISCYALTVEPKTPMDIYISKGKMKNVSEDDMVRHFDILAEQMEEYGYQHYEISNFCLPGFHSKHNTNYWQGISYLGIGPSAHSFNGVSRQWNVANLSKYIESLNAGKCDYEVEELDIDSRYNEYVMTTIRTMWGVDTEYIRKNFGNRYYTLFMNQAQGHIDQENLILDNHIVRLSKKGKLLTDAISADLFS